MKKIIFALMAAAVLMLTGCTTNLSLTFNVETGDKIKVTLDTTDSEYSLRAEDATFIVSAGENDKIHGIFLTEEMYDQRLEAAETYGNVLESGKYTLYQIDNETDVIMHVPDSSTGILIGSLEDEATVRDIMGRLTITNEK